MSRRVLVSDLLLNLLSHFPTTLISLIISYADTASGQFLTQFPLSEFSLPWGLTEYQDTLYLTDAHANSLSLYSIDFFFFLQTWLHPVSGSLLSFLSTKPKLWHPRWIEIVEDQLFLTHHYPPTLMIIDRKKNKTISQWEIPTTYDDVNFFLKVDQETGDLDRRVYVTLYEPHGVYVYTCAGKEITRFGKEEPSSKAGEFNNPQGVTVDAKWLYICDSWNHRIQVLSKTDGQFIRLWGKEGYGSPGELYFPTSITLDSSLLYVSDYYRVQVFSKTGQFLHYLGNGLSQEKGNGIQGGCGEGEFACPHGVCIVGEKIYVADSNNHRIQVFWK